MSHNAAVDKNRQNNQNDEWRWMASPYQVDITETVHPEGIYGGGDGAQLVGLQASLTLQHRAVKPRAQPAVHAAHRPRLAGTHGIRDTLTVMDNINT